MSPAAGLRAYYAALDRRDQQEAYRFFRMSGWDNNRWRQDLWRTAGCARVNDSYVLNQAPWSATVGVDLCVEDTKANKVHRWQGSLPMAKQSDGRWALSGFKGIRRAGECDSSCRPR